MNVKVDTDGYAVDIPGDCIIESIRESRRRLTFMVFAPTSAPMRLCAGVGAKAKKSKGVFEDFNISAERIESLPAPFKRSARVGSSNRVGVGAFKEVSYGNAIRS